MSEIKDRMVSEKCDEDIAMFLENGNILFF